MASKRGTVADINCVVLLRKSPTKTIACVTQLPFFLISSSCSIECGMKDYLWNYSIQLSGLPQLSHPIILLWSLLLGSDEFSEALLSVGGVSQGSTVLFIFSQQFKAATTQMTSHLSIRITSSHGATSSPCREGTLNRHKVNESKSETKMDFSSLGGANTHGKISWKKLVKYPGISGEVWRLLCFIFSDTKFKVVLSDTSGVAILIMFVS